ncbi:hypothetical protein EAE96_003403 [Botrytis aclada]|nr:hypothetical protein EAE96_003403 [Botrytis aclada]
MPPLQNDSMNKQQKINAGIEKLKAARAEAAEKKARDAANPPAKANSSTTAASMNQAPKLSTSNTISSLPRIKKRPGKSMTEVAERKAAKEAAAAAEIKRKMAEKEDGEIDSDEEEIVYKGRMNNQTKASVPASGRAPSNNKDQKIFGRNENKNEAKNTTKFKPDIPKLPPGVQKSQDLKNAKENSQSPVKRKYFDTDSSESEEEIAKPAKKPKTTKAGMNFENRSTKRKSTEEAETTSPVKKQKITESPKVPVAVPSKRAPIKETKVRNNPTKNLLSFGGSKSTKKPTAPKKGPMQPQSASETVKEKGEKSTENVLKSVSAQVKPKVVATQSESAASKSEEPSKHRYLPGVSMEELFGEAPNVAAQPIESPRSASDSTLPRSAFDKPPVKTKSIRRGPTPAPKVEATKSSTSSGSMPTMAATKVAQPSRRKVAPAPVVEVTKPSASVQNISPASTSKSSKAQSSRRGATPASKDEVNKRIPSSIPLPTSSSIEKVQPDRRRAVPAPRVELKKPAVSSNPLTTKTTTTETSGTTSSTSVPKKVIKKGSKTDGVMPAPRSPVADRPEYTKNNMEKKEMPKKVVVPKQPKSAAEIDRYIPAESKPEAEVLPETKINEDVVSLAPKVSSSSQAQRPMPQFLGFRGLPAASSDKESVFNDLFKFENAKETFKDVTRSPELSDTANDRDAMEPDLERKMQLELQNSFHAEQLRTALEEAIVLRTENGETSDQDSSDDDDSEEYSSEDESDEEQCEVPQSISKPTILYKGYNGVLQEEPFYARDRGYESEMSDADDDDEREFVSPWFRKQAYDYAHPYIRGSVFNTPVARKPFLENPAVPDSAFDGLEAEMDRFFEAQKAEDAAAEEESSPQVYPRSAFDNIEAEDDFSSTERHQQDHSEEVASAPVESSMFSVNNSTVFEGDFHGSSFDFNDSSGQESTLTAEDPLSLLDTALTFSNSMEMQVEQSLTSEGDDSDSTKESSNKPEEETPRTGPYVSLDGCIGLPPLEDVPDDSEDSGDSDNYDEASDSDTEDSEMSESDDSEIIISDDTTPTESEEDEDPQSLDQDEDAELYQKHRVLADLANVDITMEPAELQLLKAKTSWELFELQKWEQENGVEVYATFDRELLLRNLNVSKKRIAKYLKVMKTYENRTVPKAEAEDDSSDDSDDDEWSHPTTLDIPQNLEIIDVPDSTPDVDLDTEVDSNAHPFGPIDW